VRRAMRDAGAAPEPSSRSRREIYQAEELTRENAALRNRLSRLIQANLRINESLDFDTVIQGVLDSARSLTDAL
jgi:hypothetical protein